MTKAKRSSPVVAWAVVCDAPKSYNRPRFSARKSEAAMLSRPIKDEYDRTIWYCCGRKKHRVVKLVEA